MCHVSSNFVVTASGPSRQITAYCRHSYGSASDMHRPCVFRRSDLARPLSSYHLLANNGTPSLTNKSGQTATALQRGTTDHASASGVGLIKIRCKVLKRSHPVSYYHLYISFLISRHGSDLTFGCHILSYLYLFYGILRLTKIELSFTHAQPHCYSHLYSPNILIVIHHIVISA